jgi:hypothetical protein
LIELPAVADDQFVARRESSIFVAEKERGWH